MVRAGPMSPVSRAAHCRVLESTSVVRRLPSSRSIAWNAHMDGGKSRRTPRAPASGERAALSGYDAQLRIAAARIRDAFERGTLEQIAVADPEAGTADDFQMVTMHEQLVRLDAFQVKWSSKTVAIA